jgi:hypothetical protein
MLSLYFRINLQTFDTNYKCRINVGIILDVFILENGIYNIKS